MARRQPDMRGDRGKAGEEATGTDTGGRGPPPGGETDARRLARDGTGFGEAPDAAGPGDAAKGPRAVHPEPKGD